MDFNLSEDELGIDCMNFVDSSTSTPVIMREICGGEKITYQEPPQTTNSTCITSMLIDEAPDNFLSSAALEKNIFSDDDEYGLQRLKKSDRNFENPSWESDFNTDDVIRKESELGLDMVNFPPPPPAPPPPPILRQISKDSNAASENRSKVIGDKHPAEGDNNEKNGDLKKSDGDNEAVILYEVTTDCESNREGADRKSQNHDGLSVSDGNNGSMTMERDVDTDETSLSALNDHNYISLTSFGSVVHYTTYYMSEAEKKCLLQLICGNRGGNGAIVEQQQPEDASSDEEDDDEDDDEDEGEDDDRASLATTASFNPSESRKNESDDDEEESAESDDENIPPNQGAADGQSVSHIGICKQELIIDDRRQELEQDQSESSEALGESQDSTKSNDEVKPMIIINQAIGSQEVTPQSQNGENEIMRDSIQFLSQTPLPVRENNDNSSERSKTTDELSAASMYFSEGRSEPIEYMETEENSSSSESGDDEGGENAVVAIKKDNKVEEADSVAEAEKSITQKETESRIEQGVSNEQPIADAASSVKKSVSKTTSDAGVQTGADKSCESPTQHVTNENSKVSELRIFANRLLNFCDNGNSNDNLDAVLVELLIDFQDILGKRSICDKSMQTEKLYSKEKRSKMNEKAKRKLLNASSSSSDSNLSSSDEDGEIEAQSYVNRVVAVDEEIDGIAGDEDKLEKSPSYSDLSGRASSEEFLITEADENELCSNSDGLDLAKYVLDSEKAASTFSDNLDLSQYEIQSRVESCPSIDHNIDLSQYEIRSEIDAPSANYDQSVVEASQKDDEANVLIKDVNQEEVPQDATSPVQIGDALVAKNEATFEDRSATDMDDAEMNDLDREVENELDRINAAVEAGKVELNCDEEMKSVNDVEDSDANDVQNMIETDEKLKSDAMVVISKLSDEDLETYYDSLREKEIHRLLNYSGLIKRRTTDTVISSSDKIQNTIKAKKTQKLMEILKETENDICSDESNSEAEETEMTEREFLKLCNKNAKDDILKSSSSDSELDTKASDAEEMDAINVSGYTSSEEEEGPSIVDKFLEKFSTQVEEEVEDVQENEPVPVALPEVNEEIPEEAAAVGTIESRDKEEDSTIKEVTRVIDDTLENECGSIDDSSADELSDEVELVHENIGEVKKTTPIKMKEKDEPVSNTTEVSLPTAKQPSSSGISRYIRNLLTEEKEIDIDAIEKGPIPVSEEETGEFNKSLSRRPASTKSLETLIEESRRRLNAKSSEGAAVVTLDSDSDLEELANEPEIRTRSIKPMLRKDQLAGETRTAQRRESERLKRLEKKGEMLTKMVGEYRKNKEVAIEADQIDELILDYNSETTSFIKVHPDIVKHLKPHQIDGIKFMYDNTYGSVDNLKRHPGSGCILAHCMGLGKTLQIVALLHTVITYKELDTAKILVLCPKSTVMNWADEIRRWLGPAKCGNLKIFSFNDASGTTIEDKIKILREWASSGRPGFRRAGCLLLGYEAFRMLVSNPLHKKRIISPAQHDRIKQMIRDTLLDPGADLVICDEGHIIKNRKSATSSAVSEINTPRRIILTGTPIQNNLKEYYAMVNFIKPKFLGTEKEFANLYENPIRNGQHKDSNKRDIKIMKQRSFVLHKKLSKFVQRREAALLKTFLPMKFEYVLFIPMTDVQIKLYEYFLEVSSKREGSKGKTLIPDYTCLRKIWTHPRVLENAWKNAVLKSKQAMKKSPIREHNSDDELPDDVLYDSQTGALSVTDDWWRSLITDDNLQSILPSSKLQVMFEILRMCTENGEKCLIFSAFVAVLDCVEYFMNEINKQGEMAREYGLTKYRGPWESGKDYYRLDGKTPKNIRHEMIKRFNDPKMTRARVFLISAKAGGQGINLIGANRVMILDTSWNPSNDQQNIFRVFRLGQKRQCYVYRLLAMGTMEEKVYSRSVTKQAMSFRVVDEQQIDRHYSMAELTELYTLTKADYQNRPVPLLPQDSILASLLRNSPHLVYKYHEHDSLLENKLEQELSEQEKADAWDAYERDLQSSQNPEQLPGLNNIPAMYPNSPFFPPGLPYGFGPDRNYPMGYGSSLPPGYLASLGYSSNSSLMDMLKMFPSPPPMPGLNPGPPGSAPGSMMHPYGPGVLQPSVSQQSPHPMSLPAFSALQNMVSSTGVSSMPSYTSPYSSMANSYNMPADPALLRLSQMYASSLGAVGTSGGSMSRIDSRSPPGMPHRHSPSANVGNDKRISPFPTGLMPPSTMAESIPTSVIRPPQAHSASTARHAMPAPSLSHQLNGQTHPGQFGKPGPSGNNEIPSLQQQLLSQSRLPPPGLQSLLQNHMPNLRLSEIPQSRVDSTPAKSPVATTTVASAIPSIMTSMSAPGPNRNSSPVTVPPRNSPQSKGPTSVNSHRATNMGIVYPPESTSATITPIISTSSPGSSSANSISVRSVSSINSGSGGAKNSIPASIIQKQGGGGSPMYLKQNNVIAPSSTISANTSVTVSTVGKQQNSGGLTKQSASPLDKSPSSPNLSGSSLLAQLRQQAHTSQKPDKNGNRNSEAGMEKATIQILGSNNVQLTKVPNSRSVLSKSQNNLVSTGRQQAPVIVNSKAKGGQSPISSVPNSPVMSKARPTAGLSVLPVPNNNANSASSIKMALNSAMNAVPTLVPLSSKTNPPNAGRPTVIGTSKTSGAPAANMTATNPGSKNVNHLQLTPVRGTNSPTPATLLKKQPGKVGRPPTQMPKNAQASPISTTPGFPGGSLVKRAASLSSIPPSKQQRPTLNNVQTPRPPSTLQAGQRQASIARITNVTPGKLPSSNPSNSVANLPTTATSLNSKTALSIRSIDAINKFASVGITISPGKNKATTGNIQALGSAMNQAINNAKGISNAYTGNVNSLSNSVTLSKVVAPTSKKRPAASVIAGQPKKPRIATTVTERNVAESLLRARSNQGLTILLKNPQGNQQKTTKDGKVTDVVEID